MLGPIFTVLGALFLVAMIIVIVFYLGMRAKTPWVLDGVRRFARGIGNPYQMRTAGSSGAYASVVRHVGRKSGTAYSTPVAAEPTEDGFVIAIVYGANTDWLKNVLASGSATIIHEGHDYRVGDPEIISTQTVAAYFPAKARRSLERFRVGQCLRVRRIEQEERLERLERLERPVLSRAG